MADNPTPDYAELKNRLLAVEKLIRESRHALEGGYSHARTQLSREDYGHVVVSDEIAKTDLILGNIAGNCQWVAAEAILLAANTEYRCEVRVGFPYGITHFKCNNDGTGGDGTVEMFGRNDTPNSLFSELFSVNDVVLILTSQGIGETSLNVPYTIKTITGNKIEFTEAFTSVVLDGGLPIADYTFHMVTKTRYAA